MATIIIPTPLRKFTGAQSKVDLNGNTVGELIQDLTIQFPDLKKHLLDEKNEIRTFVNIFIEEDDIRDREFLATPVNANSVISIVPAIAGGIQDLTH